MRVLFVGDAVVASGFSRVTHAVCDELHAQGHEVHVLGINYRGDPTNLPYKVYPCVQPFDGGNDPTGNTRLPILSERLNPDVIVILNDPWNIPAYLLCLKMSKTHKVGCNAVGTWPDGRVKTNENCLLTDCDCGAWGTIPPIVGYLAVDAKNQRGTPLNDLAHVSVWTNFAGEELRRGGYYGNYSVIPLGVDTSIFYPHDQYESRRATINGVQVLPNDIPGNAFIVGVVGRNQPRKRIDLTIEYFAEWIHTHEIHNAYLYLYIAPTADVGCDIGSLVGYYGLGGDKDKCRVLLNEPKVGQGNDSSSLPLIYSSFDVLLTCSQAEGWNLCALEAMACGVPVIGGDWSGFGDWAKSAACLVPCTSHAVCAPLNSQMYTIGGIPDKKLTINTLNYLYREGAERVKRGKLGVGLAATLPWDATGKSMVRVLEAVVANSKVKKVTASGNV